MEAPPGRPKLLRLAWTLESAGVTIIPASFQVKIDKQKERPIAYGELIVFEKEIVITWDCNSTSITTGITVNAGQLSFASEPESITVNAVACDPAVFLRLSLLPMYVLCGPWTNKFRLVQDEFIRLRHFRLLAPQLAPAGPEPLLVHPGRMSGDLWHLIFALHLDPRLRLFLQNEADKGDNRANVENCNAIVALLQNLGLSTRFDVVESISSTDNDTARDACCQKYKNSSARPCGMTWASTSVIVAAAARSADSIMRDVASTNDNKTKNIKDGHYGQMDLSNKFSTLLFGGSGLDHLNSVDIPCRADVVKKVSDFLGQLKDNERYLLVNMRFAGQNPQHNMTRNKLDSICSVANMLEGFSKKIKIVLLGAPVEVLVKGKESGWVSDWYNSYSKRSSVLQLDIFDEGNPHSALYRAMKTDKRLQPYFWRRLFLLAAQQRRELMLLGGRSGSMDIASFMGMRTASWDAAEFIYQKENHHYMRLHWASAFNSIIPMAQDSLDKLMLGLWLQKLDIIPVAINDPVLPTPIGTVSNLMQETHNDAVAYTNGLSYHLKWFE
jgi:hypothetical protein